MTLGDLHQSLEDHLDAAGADPDVASQTGLFRIDSLERADWAVRRLARIRRRLNNAKEVAAAEADRIADWLAAELERSVRDQSFLLDLLGDYHRRILDEDPRQKTISLPAGKLKAIKQPDRWDITDEFLEWAVDNAPWLVRTKVSPERQVIKDALITGEVAYVLRDTGEFVPGVTVTPGTVQFTVKTDQ